MPDHTDLTIEQLEQVMAAENYRATLMLADHAAVADGKLYISGGGWDRVQAPIPPTALAALIAVPVTRAGQTIKIRFDLTHPDGSPTLDPAGEPISLTGEIQVTSPHNPQDDITHYRLPFAINLSPLPLHAGGEHEWRLSIDDLHRQDWKVSFRVL